MAAEHFYISQLHPVVNDMADHFRQARHIAAWEDVLVDPSIVGPALLAGDSVNQGHAVFFQIAGHVFEVQAHVFLAHVLKHPHGSDIVPLPVTQFPVVGQLDFRDVLQPFGFNRLSDQVVLLFAQGHPGNLQAIFPGRRQHQGPPAAADVQQSLALFRV